MPNQDIIFAVARDTNVGAKSSNGVTWSSSNVATNEYYPGFGGTIGKFIYLVVDKLRIHSIKVFGMSDYTLWRSGVLPSEQVSVIVAIANDLTTLFYSFNGDDFITGPETL